MIPEHSGTLVPGRSGPFRRWFHALLFLGKKLHQVCAAAHVSLLEIGEQSNPRFLTTTKKWSDIFEEKYFLNRHITIFPITPYQKTFKKYRIWCANFKIKAHQFALKSSHSSQNPVQIRISFKILKEVVISIATNSLRILKEIWIWTGFWELWELFRANW